MPLWLWFLIGLVTILMVWRDHRKEAHASEKDTWDCPGGEELKARIQDIDRADRRARLLAPWHTPWPWWFLGSCIAFAVLCLVAGVSSWPANDAPALLVGGTIFLLALTFKAWAQR